MTWWRCAASSPRCAVPASSTPGEGCTGPAPAGPRLLRRAAVAHPDGTHAALVRRYVGDTTQYTYGVNNRIYAKRRMGQTSRAMEIMNISLTQTYYTDPRQAQCDRQYTTGLGNKPTSPFSPVAVNVRATPSLGFNARLYAEFDSTERELRTMSADGTYSLGPRIQATAGWSKRFFIEDVPGFDVEQLSEPVHSTQYTHLRLRHDPSECSS